MIDADIKEVAGILTEVDTPFGEKESGDLLKQFQSNSDEVSRYISARKWQTKFRPLPLGVLLIGYIVAIIIALALSPLTTWPEESSNIIALSVFLLTALIAGILILIRRIIKNRAEKLGVSPEEATYHELANAIETFKTGETNETGTSLKLVSILLDFEDNHPFDTRTNEQLAEYIRDIELGDSGQSNSTSELLQTFPHVANHVLWMFGAMESNKLVEISTEIHHSKSERPNYRIRDMINSYIHDLFSHQIVRISAPVITALALVAVIYTYVDEFFAELTFFALLGITQIYYNLSRKDRSNLSGRYGGNIAKYWIRREGEFTAPGARVRRIPRE